MVRKKIKFHGWVQGVGFRYRAREAAELYGCTGWVKNEYDGSVTMEIQGSEEQIGQVISAIERGRFIRIEDIEAKTIPVDPDRHQSSIFGTIELNFRVRYGNGWTLNVINTNLYIVSHDLIIISRCFANVKSFFEIYHRKLRRAADNYIEDLYLT